MKALIIAIVGMCGTGKSLVTDYIRDRHNFKVVYLGGFVLDELKKMKLEVSPEIERTVRESMRKKSGMAVMADKAVPHINRFLKEKSNVVIDGLYSYSEYIELKDLFPKNFYMIAIHTSKKIRYERMKARPIRPLSQKQVDTRDFFEIQNLEKGGPIAVADYHVINDSGVETLYQTVDQILSLISDENKRINSRRKNNH